MAVRGCNVHGPVAGAAHIGLTALFDALESAPAAFVVMLAFGRADQFAEFVIQSLIAKIAFLFRNPFLKPKMRFDDELGHGILRCRRDLPIVVDEKPIPRR